MKKKKLQLATVTQDKAQDQDKELLGSEAYLSGYKLDVLDRQLRRKIKENEYENDARKRALILNAAERYVKAGYPERMICKRISDLLSKPEYNTSSSYVRRVLPERYKNLEQMMTAKKQNVSEGVNKLRLIAEVAKKADKDIGLEDLKYITLNKLKHSFKYQMARADMLEELVSQYKAKLGK